MADWIAPNSQAYHMWLDSERVSTMDVNWSYDIDKHDMEKRITSWIGQVDSVADLGCGTGRMAAALDCRLYHGFDFSEAMLAKARNRLACKLDRRQETAFSLVDVFQYSPRFYDVALLYDVAVHQVDPIAAVLKVLGLWAAGRTIFTVLVGDRREELLLSTVVPFSELLRVFDVAPLSRMHVERVHGEAFAVALVEVRNG